MNNKLLTSIFTLVFCFTAATHAHAEFRKGDKLETLVNLHPDMAKRFIYTTNYQQVGGLIPVCTEVTVQKFSRKALVFLANGIQYTMAYDKHTKNAGVSFENAVKDFFGPRCDSKKIAGLGAKDKEGIKSGTPVVGMTKQGVIFAMGRPPYHVNPSLESNNWMYWQNRFNRVAIEFNDKGVVTAVRN